MQNIRRGTPLIDVVLQKGVGHSEMRWGLLDPWGLSYSDIKIDGRDYICITKTALTDHKKRAKKGGRDSHI